MVILFFTVLVLTLTGCIIAAIPNINSEFVIQLPRTLPNTISVLPDANALIDTANSGAEVPNAIIVNPISIFDTLKFWAVEDAPSTNMSAPFIKSTNPKTNNKMLIIIFNPYLYNKYFTIKKAKKLFIFAY